MSELDSPSTTLPTTFKKPRKYPYDYKKKTGRPTKYKSSYPKKLLKFITKGGPMITRPMIVSVGNNGGSEIIDHPIGQLPARFEGFCRVIGISKETFDRWQDEHPKFGDAYRKSKTIQLEQLLQGMTSSTYQVAATIFDLKNNHGFRDRHEVETHGELIVSYPPDWRSIDTAVGIRMGSSGPALPAPPNPGSSLAVVS